MKARYIIIPVVIIAAIALSAWVLTYTLNQKPKYELFEVRRGAVAKTVSVAGSVISGQKFELGFLTPGIVKDVKVKVGDIVKADDLLVVQDVSVLEAQANQARASIASASAMLNKTKNALRPTDINVLNQSLNNARVALTTARNNLQEAYRSQSFDRTNAEVALRAAESAYQNASQGYQAQINVIDQGLIGAQQTFGNATNALSNAQSAYSQMLNLYNAGQTTFAQLQQAQLTLSAANSTYMLARTAYDTAVQQANLQKISARSSLDAAEAQLNSARAAYNSAGNGVDLKISSAQNAVNAAEAAYNLAYAQYQQALAPAHGADISSASAQVAAAVASLRIVEAQIAKATIKAPIDGVITAVNAKSHEISPLSSPAIVIETGSAFQAEAFVSEMDVQKVLPGAKVKISLDALPGLEVEGVVATVDPSATIMLGVVNYKIKIALPVEVAGLKSAMTADLEILTDKRENVLFVPRKAVTKTDAEYTVKILADNAKDFTERVVEVGLVGDSETEIISGLTEGDKIVLREL